jgi:hypothetical protein
MQPASVTDGAQTSREGTGQYVWVSYTWCLSEPSSLLLIRTCRKDSRLFFSTSIVNLMYGWTEMVPEMVVFNKLTRLIARRLYKQ